LGTRLLAGGFPLKKTNMKALKNILPALIALVVSVTLTGCGGDDDDDDNNNNNNQPQQFAPTTAAALTDANAIYTVNIAGQGATTLRFPAAGQYQTIANGQTVNGTISNLQRNGNVWTATLTPDANQQGAQGGALTLTWTGNNAGTFTLQPQGAAAQSGTFTVTQAQNPGNGGQNTNTNGGGPVTNPPAGGLIGKTLQLNYQPSGGEKFVFTSEAQNGDISTGNAVYEDTDAATYQYNRTTGQLNFTRTAGNQTYQLVIPPGSTTGTTTVTYQQPGGQPDVQTASFTLQ
jgi:hypothetical protein